MIRIKSYLIFHDLNHCPCTSNSKKHFSFSTTNRYKDVGRRKTTVINISTFKNNPGHSMDTSCSPVSVSIEHSPLSSSSLPFLMTHRQSNEQRIKREYGGKILFHSYFQTIFYFENWPERSTLFRCWIDHVSILSSHFEWYHQFQTFCTSTHFQETKSIPLESVVFDHFGVGLRSVEISQTQILKLMLVLRPIELSLQIHKMTMYVRNRKKRVCRTHKSPIETFFTLVSHRIRVIQLFYLWMTSWWPWWRPSTTEMKNKNKNWVLCRSFHSKSSSITEFGLYTRSNHNTNEWQVEWPTEAYEETRTMFHFFENEFSLYCFVWLPGDCLAIDTKPMETILHEVLTSLESTNETTKTIETAVNESRQEMEKNQTILHQLYEVWANRSDGSE